VEELKYNDRFFPRSIFSACGSRKNHPRRFFFHKISDSDGRFNHLSYYEDAVLFLDTNSQFN